jgi:MFS family permease
VTSTHGTLERPTDTARRPAFGGAAVGRRVGFVVTAYAFAITMLGTTLPTPLYPTYSATFGFSELMVTVIFATYAVGVIAALLLLGGLSDQIGRRPMLLVGLAFSALSAVAFLTTHGIGLLFVGRILSGLSAGIFTGTATATLTDLGPSEAPGRATLVATVTNMAGLGAGPLFAGLLVEFAPLPLRLTFWVDLGLVVLAAVLVWAMPEPVSGTRRAGRGLPRPPRVPAAARATFVRAALAGFAGFAVLGLFTAVAPAFLGEILGIHRPAIVGLVVFAVFAASAVGQTVLVGLFGRRAMIAGSAGLIAGMVLLALGLGFSSLGLVVAGGVLAGLGQGLSFRPAVAAVNAAAPPRQRGEVASGFFVVLYVAISLPVVGEGLVATLAGVRAAGLIFAAVVAALAATVVVLLARSSQEER